MTVLPQVAAFVIPLGFDTLAVAVMVGLTGLRPLRPALTFAFFEAVMPLVGLLLGRIIGVRYETLAVVLGGVILLGVAVHVVRETFEEEDEAARLSFSTMRTAALAGFGISMDELAVGFPMGTKGLPVLATIAAIAAQAFVVTYVGVTAGTYLGATLGRRTARFASLLAAIGFGGLGLYLIAQRFIPGLP